LELLADEAVYRCGCSLMGQYAEGAERRWGFVLMGMLADGDTCQ
jgi:hypothetical protein